MIARCPIRQWLKIAKLSPAATFVDEVLFRITCVNGGLHERLVRNFHVNAINNVITTITTSNVLK